MASEKNKNARRKPQQARSQKLVGWILHAAAQVFAERGYAGGTTNHIAEKAGVSIGSLYQYFPNKTAILTALALNHLNEGEMLAQKLRGQARTPSLPLEELLRLFMTSFVALHEENPRLHRLLLEEAPLPAEVWKRYRDLMEQLTLDLAEGLRVHPEVSVQNHDHAAYLLVHVAESLTHQLVIHPSGGLSTKEGVNEAVIMLQRYLKG
jgi:AcrR family transcriptional regulator